MNKEVTSVGFRGRYIGLFNTILARTKDKRIVMTCSINYNSKLVS